VGEARSKRRPCARRWWWRLGTARRSGRNYREEARARRIYGAATSYNGVGGVILRWRRNPTAAARWENGGRGEEISAVVYSRGSPEMPRSAADASHLASG
jgi:hypothetical protein